MFQKILSTIEEIEHKKKQKEAKKVANKYKDMFTEYFTPLFQRTPYFIESTLKDKVSSGGKAYVTQNYPFGSLTLELNDKAHLSFNYSNNEKGLFRNKSGIFHMNISQELIPSFYLFINGIPFYEDVTQEIIKHLEEYPLILRNILSISYYLSERQIHVFRSQGDEEMVKYFQDKQKEFQQQLIGL